MTQTEVAARLGVSQSFVSKYKIGERRVDVIEFLRIADILDFDVHDIMRRITANEENFHPVSILEELGLTVSELTGLIYNNPSLRRMEFRVRKEQ